ncbi:hypothetical protein [Haemophilus haemolyticus]|jgi:hypothetical protein|uniref:Uncharacterized protein n=1 Tax=Haemophilus haemolyticus TaxID=726 RepID=A0A1B8PHJ3_HAEHA|nr:hypothetical protein [Haemophilus haemolyticus]OBX48441.1 hypothetical protein A9Z62_00095 [Haemophilus haemolyticus]
MKKNSECLKNMFIYISKYKYIFIFIGIIIAIESILIYVEYFSSWISLYICLMLFVVDIEKTFLKKIIMSLICFVILVCFSWVIYRFFVESHENTNQLSDIVLSLFIPFVFYFSDYYWMKSKVKEIQEYEDKK